MAKIERETRIKASKHGGGEKGIDRKGEKQSEGQKEIHTN